MATLNFVIMETLIANVPDKKSTLVKRKATRELEVTINHPGPNNLLKKLIKANLG